MLGMLAHRTIRRYPDMLTGHGLANAGIALGLIFGLGSANVFDGAELMSEPVWPKRSPSITPRPCNPRALPMS